MALRVIGVVGLPGSGKTEVVRTMAEFGAPSVRMGDVVWQELKRRGQRITESSVGRLSNELRKEEGMDAIAKRCIPLVKANGRGKEAVVVDGIRGIAEVEEFRKEFGKDFHLIAVWADRELRYQRTTSRKRADDATTRESLRKKDLRELSWGLGDAMALSDVMLVNDGPLEELRKRAEVIFKELMGERT